MSSQALTPGTILQSGKFTYCIQEILGQGSFGIAYLATTQVTGKTIVKGELGEIEAESKHTIKVAIKEFFMKETNSRSKDSTIVEGTNGELTKKYRKRFRKEAENLSHLNHPNIVKVLEVFDANNTTYYAMEFINGINLDEMIPPHKGLKEEYAIRIINEAAQALCYMHGKKMLHLDIKPKNIMVAEDGKAYLIDFGLSKQFDTNGELESSTSIGLGTPGYAPIEQANYVEDGTFPATIDVYALGATLYKMVTGETPPSASDVLAFGLKLPTSLSPKTNYAILNAMKPIKTERTKTINEFIQNLNKGGDNSPLPPPIPDPTKYLLGLGITLIVIIVSYFFLWDRKGQNEYVPASIEDLSDDLANVVDSVSADTISFEDVHSNAEPKETDEEKLKNAISRADWTSVEKYANKKVEGAADALALHYIELEDNPTNCEKAYKWSKQASVNVRERITNILISRGYLDKEENAISFF